MNLGHFSGFLHFFLVQTGSTIRQLHLLAITSDMAATFSLQSFLLLASLLKLLHFFSHHVLAAGSPLSLLRDLCQAFCVMVRERVKWEGGESGMRFATFC